VANNAHQTVQTVIVSKWNDHIR